MDVLDALSHDVRLRIVEALLTAGPLRQDEIRARLETVQKGTVSKHMRELRAAGIVSRTSQKGHSSVAHPDETRSLFSAGFELQRVVGAAAAAEAADRLRGLRTSE